MAQHVTGSVTDLHAEHQLAPAEQTGNRESSGGGGVCVCVCACAHARVFVGGWYTAGRWTWFGQHAKMKEVNGLILQLCEVCLKTLTSSFLLFGLSGSLQCHFILLSSVL